MATFLTASLLVIVLLLRLCPDTGLSRTVLEMLAIKPCRWWLNLSRRDAIYALVLVFALLSVGEMAMMLGSADLVFAYAVDLSIYFDAAIASTLLAATSRLRGALSAARRLITLPFRGSRARSRRKQRSADSAKPSPANDDDGPVALAA